MPTPLRDIVRALPGPDAKRAAVQAESAAERRLQSGHPWLFDDGIRRVKNAARAGQVAIVFDAANRFLAAGLLDPASPIRVRILVSGASETIDAAFFARRVDQALARRARLAEANTGYRLIHGENDGFGGLVADRYGDTAVVKLYSSAWVPHLAEVATALLARLPLERLLLRLARGVADRPEELFGLEDGMILAGPELSGPLRFVENGLRFVADPVRGQKTGFFLDQRDNRARIEGLARGARVLNVCAYTGGFSVYAARGGAREVTSLDASRPALDDAAKNFAANADHPAVGGCRHELMVGDAFALMEDMRRTGREFDLVILDPPSFAKKKDEVPGALRAYRRLVDLGLDVLSRRGVLMAASCSSRVAAAEFFDLVVAAVRAKGRAYREIERTGHAEDHPIGFAEAAYLKAIFLRTESR